MPSEKQTIAAPRTRLVVLAWILAACGSSSTDDAWQGDPTGGTVSQGPTPTLVIDGTLTDDISYGLCEWLLGCCNMAEVDDVIAEWASVAHDTTALDIALTIGRDPDACVPLAKGFVVEMLRHAEAAAAAGRARVDESAIPACLNHLTSLFPCSSDQN